MKNEKMRKEATDIIENELRTGRHYGGLTIGDGMGVDTRTVNFKVQKMNDGKHFVITAGCRIAVVHNFKEAQAIAEVMFFDEYRSFFVVKDASHEEHMALQEALEKKLDKEKKRKKK